MIALGAPADDARDRAAHDAEWARRWELAEVALQKAADLQVALGGSHRDRDLIADLVRENDLADALLFGATLIRHHDDRPEARELAELLLPHAAFLIEFELDRPTDPSPLRAYEETVDRLRSAVEPG